MMLGKMKMVKRSYSEGDKRRQISRLNTESE